MLAAARVRLRLKHPAKHPATSATHAYVRPPVYTVLRRAGNPRARTPLRGPRASARPRRPGPTLSSDDDGLSHQQRARNGPPSRHRGRSAAQHGGRAVGPRRDSPLGEAPLRPGHRGGAETRGLLLRAPRGHLPRDARALRREPARRPADRRRPAEDGREARGRGRRRRGGRAHRRRPLRRQCPALRADRARGRAHAPAPHHDLRDPGERPGPPRAAPGAHRERGALDARGCPRRPSAGLPRSRRGPPPGDRPLAGALPRGALRHWRDLGLPRPGRDHRRIPAREPDRDRRPPVDGQERARHEHRRERRAGQEPPQADRAVLARDVRGRAGAALHRVAGADQGRRPAQGPPQGGAPVAQGPGGLGDVSTPRRSSSTTRATSACSKSARRPAGCTTRARAGWG